MQPLSEAITRAYTSRNISGFSPLLPVNFQNICG